MTLDYSYIRTDYKDKLYETTRKYFIRNGYEGKLREGRNLVMLPGRNFDIAKAVLGDANLEVEQLDIFDAIAIDKKIGEGKMTEIFMKSMEKKAKKKGLDNPKTGKNTGYTEVIL